MTDPIQLVCRDTRVYMGREDIQHFPRQLSCVKAILVVCEKLTRQTSLLAAISSLFNIRTARSRTISQGDMPLANSIDIR